MDKILILIAIGYSLGFVLITYFAIVGTNEVIDYHNNKKGK